MKRFPLFSVLVLCLSRLFAHAGVQEDYPDIFPKEPGSSAEKNGWDLVPTMKQIKTEDIKGMPSLSDPVPEQLSRLDVKKTRDLAAKYAENLRLFEKVMAAPRLHSDDWRTFRLDDSGRQSLLWQWKTAGLILWKAMADARDGDLHQGMEAGLEMNRFGLKVCEAEPMLSDLIFASMLIRFGSGTVACMATMPGVDTAGLRRAARETDACDRVAAAMRRGIRGECRWNLMSCESLVKGGQARRNKVLELAAFREWESAVLGKSAKRSNTEPGEPADLLEQWKQALPENVQAALRDADRVNWEPLLKAEAGYYLALIKADNRSLTAFRASFSPPEDIDVTKGTALEPLFSSPVVGSIEKGYIHSTTNSTARLRLARAILLLRAYELDHGRLPASLDELVPDYWASVPKDPFDEKPLRYDAAARRVWCVAENLKDDKGANDYKAKDKPDDVVMTFPVWK